MESTQAEKREIAENGGEPKKAKVDIEKEGGDQKRTKFSRIIEK